MGDYFCHINSRDYKFIGLDHHQNILGHHGHFHIENEHYRMCSVDYSTQPPRMVLPDQPTGAEQLYFFGNIRTKKQI